MLLGIGGGSGGGLVGGKGPGGGGDDLGADGVDVHDPVRGILGGFKAGMARGEEGALGVAGSWVSVSCMCVVPWFRMSGALVSSLLTASLSRVSWCPWLSQGAPQSMFSAPLLILSVSSSWLDSWVGQVTGSGVAGVKKSRLIEGVLGLVGGSDSVCLTVSSFL